MLGGTAAAWPLAARAQQQRVPLVGFLRGGTAAGGANLLAAFRKSLSETGFVEGRNVEIEFRWGLDSRERQAEAAADMVRRKVNVIVAPGFSVAALAAKALTATIPIVFTTSGDPVQLGLVSSLSRPDGNVTGFTNSDAEMGGKWLQFLKEADPRLSRVGVFFNPLSSPRGGRYFLDPIESAAAALGLPVAPVHITDPSQIEAAVAAHAGSPVGGFVVPPDPLLVAHRRALVEAAARYHVPAIYPYRYFMDAGGLMSYGPALEVRTAEYVNLILRGAKPAELPVQSPRRYELLINRKAAQALGLALPLTLLARADQMIE